MKRPNEDLSTRLKYLRDKFEKDRKDAEKHQFIIEELKKYPLWNNPNIIVNIDIYYPVSLYITTNAHIDDVIENMVGPIWRLTRCKWEMKTRQDGFKFLTFCKIKKPRRMWLDIEIDVNNTSDCEITTTLKTTLSKKYTVRCI